MSDKIATSPGQLVEVFVCDNEILARMVVDEILLPQGVSSALHDRSSHSLPAPASMAGVFGVAVANEDAAQARLILLEAQRDKVLLDDGEIVEATVA
jgi:hypothetical protein